MITLHLSFRLTLISISLPIISTSCSVTSRHTFQELNLVSIFWPLLRHSFPALLAGISLRSGRGFVEYNFAHIVRLTYLGRTWTKSVP